MASKYKSPSEVELVAIYRLEFYKKQKNWKFCQDVCKKKVLEPAPMPTEDKGPAKSANSTKSALNKTYNLETEEDPLDLNDAFLEPDPDKILPVTPPDPTNPPHFNNPHKTESNIPEQQWPETELQWPEIQKTWPESEQQWLDAKTQWAETWPEANKVWSVPEMPEQGWQNVGQEWGGEEAYYPPACDTLRAYEMDRGWPETEADNAYVEQPAEAVLSDADNWLRETQQWPTTNEDARSLSMDSVVSFMRGAAAAPHSSEVDLNISESSDKVLSGSSAACLSARQLAARVRRHAAALRLLLREAALRAAAGQQHTRSTLSVDYRTPNALNLTCEERPTRDIDLFHPLKDSFVAGSFKNSEPIGRGRGRLHRERLIGIGMGRPYRL